MHRLDLFSRNSFSCENRYRVLLAAAGQSCMHVLLFILLLQDTFLSHQFSSLQVSAAHGQLDLLNRPVPY
jgi:hypothetical protein